MTYSQETQKGASSSLNLSTLYILQIHPVTLDKVCHPVPKALLYSQAKLNPHLA